MSCYSYPENIVKNPFQARGNHCQNVVCRGYIQGSLMEYDSTRRLYCANLVLYSRVVGTSIVQPNSL